MIFLSLCGKVTRSTKCIIKVRTFSVLDYHLVVRLNSFCPIPSFRTGAGGFLVNLINQFVERSLRATLNPLQRFSSRVENYIKYRPGYPKAVLDLLQKNCGLSKDSVVADIGSGTGKLSELFLHFGCHVLGVEPNEVMRGAAEPFRLQFSRFENINGSAEATTLSDTSVDMIVAGQAFHWFDPGRARLEFTRILKTTGWVALIWNERQLDSTPFLRRYEELLLKFGTDYQQVRHENVTSTISDFFAPSVCQMASLDNAQHFDFEALKGRLLSSSYTPEPNHPDYAPMLEDLWLIFRECQRDGLVTFEYDTKIFYGQLASTYPQTGMRS